VFDHLINDILNQHWVWTFAQIAQDKADSTIWILPAVEELLNDS
jgi:predicted flap endonuclease-1-like 5' DNA nuclease